VGRRFYYLYRMITYNPKSWMNLIFMFHKSDTFRILLPAIIGITIYSTLISYIEIEIFELRFRSTGALHSLLGFVISLLLVFRTNTAYERWWEGRKAWGALVNNSRNLALKLNAFLGEGHFETKRKLDQLIGSYPNILKEHLRNRKVVGISQEIHQPNFIAGELMKECNGLYKQNLITGDQLIIINNEITALTDNCGICERIKKTPIPYSYSLFLKKFIFVYILTMPFSFVKDFGYLIIPAVTFMFYVLASLEIIAEEIEDPFGVDANDLPTDEIAATIQQNVSEIFAERKL
jgi:putative membrane protein